MILKRHIITQKRGSTIFKYPQCMTTIFACTAGLVRHDCVRQFARVVHAAVTLLGVYMQQCVRCMWLVTLYYMRRDAGNVWRVCRYVACTGKTKHTSSRACGGLAGVTKKFFPTVPILDCFLAMWASASASSSGVQMLARTISAYLRQTGTAHAQRLDD